MRYQEVRCVTDIKPEDMLYLAAFYLNLYHDWTSYNETCFTGWGDGDVPPGAEWLRVKSGQAVAALAECGSIPPIGYGEDGEVNLPYWEPVKK